MYSCGNVDNPVEKLYYIFGVWHSPLLMLGECWSQGWAAPAARKTFVGSLSQAVASHHDHLQKGGDIMDAELVQMISGLINNNLFPIAMCVVLVWYIKGEQDKNRESMQQLTKVISDNTTTMRELQVIVKEHLCSKWKEII